MIHCDCEFAHIRTSICTHCLLEMLKTRGMGGRLGDCQNRAAEDSNMDESVCFTILGNI